MASFGFFLEDFKDFEYENLIFFFSIRISITFVFLNYPLLLNARHRRKGPGDEGKSRWGPGDSIPLNKSDTLLSPL